MTDRPEETRRVRRAGARAHRGGRSGHKAVIVLAVRAAQIAVDQALQMTGATRARDRRNGRMPHDVRPLEKRLQEKRDRRAYRRRAAHKETS